VRAPPAATAGAPLYETLLPGTSTVTLSGDDFNDLDQNRFYLVPGTGVTRTVRVQNSPDDLDIHVYQNGTIIRSAQSAGGSPAFEEVSFPTAVGQRYVVVITGFRNSPGGAVYSAQLQFQ
jgi:hypothetical protein